MKIVRPRTFLICRAIVLQTTWGVFVAIPHQYLASGLVGRVGFAPSGYPNFAFLHTKYAVFSSFFPLLAPQNASNVLFAVLSVLCKLAYRGVNFLWSFQQKIFSHAQFFWHFVLLDDICKKHLFFMTRGHNVENREKCTNTCHIDCTRPVQMCFSRFYIEICSRCEDVDHGAPPETQKQHLKRLPGGLWKARK